MAATYKVYANPDISEGSMWIAKTIFKNTGESNIHNLKVSYKLGEYSDWSIPNAYSLIVPGGCVVDLYYPVISSKVTGLLTRTPVDAQIKYDYILETVLVTIPGHCFPVVILPGGGFLPVECTAIISGVAVGQPQIRSFSFDKAVEFASKEFSELKMGLYYLVKEVFYKVFGWVGAGGYTTPTPRG